ncbi:hypothetical protein SLEP1_g16715 [Rubroshorea leprosula]|uniref:SWIM-type domain-containing protein n=1 Tax=Rubroshorea leprosula TaxID=152421 RepID=A0AAV5J0Z8_9ROSI|nr:hypothetical protein SLEP1_g16715 [Rubroshorea leprosula]
MGEKTLTFFHGGFFLHSPDLRYIGGDRYVQNADEDKISYFEVRGIVIDDLKLNFSRLYYSIPGLGLEQGLFEIRNDIDALEMAKHLIEHDNVNVYIHNGLGHMLLDAAHRIHDVIKIDDDENENQDNEAIGNAIEGDHGDDEIDGERDSNYIDSDDPGEYVSDSDNKFFAIDDALRQKTSCPIYDPTCAIPHFELGMKFQNHIQFKKVVAKYSSYKGFAPKWLISAPDKQRLDAWLKVVHGIFLQLIRKGMIALKWTKWQGQERFNDNMVHMQGLTQAGHDALAMLDPKRWCKPFFQTYSRCDIIDNNLTETFNSWILDARCKAICSMTDELVDKLMVRHGEKKAFCRKWPTDIAPRACKKLQKQCSHCSLLPSTMEWETSFKVKMDNEAFVVEFTNSTCTCQACQLTGIPCPHACACLIDQNQNVEEYVSHYYKKDTYLEVYKEPIYHSRGGHNKTGCPKENSPDVVLGKPGHASELFVSSGSQKERRGMQQEFREIGPRIEVRES